MAPIARVWGLIFTRTRQGGIRRFWLSVPFHRGAWNRLPLVQLGAPMNLTGVGEKRRRLLATTFFTALAATPVAWAQTYQFDIPAQQLDAALSLYGEQSQKELMYSAALVEGRTAPAVIGSYSDDEALSILLQGNNLSFIEGADGAVIIRTAAAAEVATIDSDNGSSSSDDDDAYLDMDEVLVTGTNIQGVENPTVPVLTFDREDIDLSGAATVDDFLRTIPQNFASETQLTAESGNPFTSGRNRSQGTGVDLRGLGGGSTLVLLNGRRLPFSGDAAIVDVNVIPLGAIERVEILTDGATAIYGSDAVGGVINFITRDDFRGLDVNARYGTVTEGSREDWGVGGAGGFGWGSGSFFAGVDYQEEKPLLMSERDFVDLTLPDRENATFGSDSERLGLSGNLKQSIGSKLRFNINSFFTETTSASTSATDNQNPEPTFNVSEQTSLSVNPSVEYNITDRITAAFFADITRNRTDATSTETLSGIIRKLDFDNDLTVYEGRISGQAFDLPGGAVSFSVGGLYRNEEFLFDNQAVPIVGNRNIKAGFGELLLPIFGKATKLPFVQELELSLAGRYEEYSDFGDTFDPKVGLYWEVNNELSFRASYSEAFRAPDLFSINNLQSIGVSAFPASFFTGQSPDDRPEIDDFFGFGPAYIALFQSGGNPNLKPERAKTWSAGFSYEPKLFNDFTIEGNFFDISYTDRLEAVDLLASIQNPSFFGLANVDPDLTELQTIFDQEIVSNPLGFSVDQIQVLFAPSFTNVSERDVRGFDLTLNYSKETAFGDFSAGANATYLIDYVGRLTELAPSSEEINTLYRPVDFRLRGDLSWSKGGITAFTAINYVDGYRDNINRSIANGIDAWTTIDLSLVYETHARFDNAVMNNVRFGFNVTNLFDNDPPFVATPFGLNFDSANATPWGRQVNFTLAKSF